MKARSGFVSNSSSSSFIVAYKNNFADDFNKLVAVESASPLSFIIYEVGNCFLKNIDETYKSLRDYFERDGYDKDENDETIIKLLEQGYIVAIGDISDEDYDEIDAYLAHKEINIENDYIAIHSAGGY